MASIVRERLMAKLHQRQVEESERKGQLVTTRFDEPLPLFSPSPSPHPHNNTPQPSQEGRGTSLRWRLLSRRLPEAVEKNIEEQAYLFFTGTAEDLELPAPRGRGREGGGVREGEVEEGGEGEREGAASSDGEEEGEGEEGEEEEGEGEEGEGEEGEEEEGEGESGGRSSAPDRPDQEEPVEGSEGPPDSSQVVQQSNTEDSILFTGEGGSTCQKFLRPPTTLYVPHRARLEREEKVFFTPSSRGVVAAVEERTPEGMPPRYHEDEGLYVGRRPRVKWTNHVTVQNRLLNRHDNGRGWFGEDGLLLALPDPLPQGSPLRPDLLAYHSDKHISLSPHHSKRRATNRKLIPQGSGSYQLDLTLSSLSFSHHPLFSMEHVMCASLRRTCDDYHSLTDPKTSDYLLQKLYALKAASVDLQQSLENVAEGGGGGDEEGEVRANLRRYTREVRNLRRRWREREANKHRLLLSILRMWGLLKSVRERQGYSSTSLSISFRRQAVDREEEEELRERELDEEVEEEREWYELEELPRREAVYCSQLTQWRALREMRKREKMEQQRSEGSGGEGGEEEGEEEGGEEGGGRVGGEEGEEEGRERARGEGERGEEEEDREEGTETRESGSQASLTESVNPECPPPPQPPAPFHPEGVRQSLAEFYQQTTRGPGEPILVPLVHDSHPITLNPTRGEEMRRGEVGRARLKIRVFYNDRQVYTTKECSIGSGFSVHFNETFQIQIVHWPHTFKLQILECSLFSSSLLAEVYLPIPPSNQHSSPPMVSYHFSNDRVSPPVHTAVGAGEVLASLPETGVLVTSGEVKVGLCWGVDREGRVMCPPGLESWCGPMREPSPNTANLASLKKWADEAHLDPNDPRNTKFLSLLQSVPTTEDTIRPVFRLRQLHKKERFVSDEEFTNDRRFALLEHRQQGHPELKNKCIPMAKEHISASQWKAVQEYQAYKDYELPPTYQGDFHGNRREERNHFLLQIREQVLSRVRSGRAKLRLDDVIHYDIIPSISGLKTTLLELVSPRRPLKPRRKPTRKAKAQNQQISEAKIVVRIVRAFGVPLRNHLTSDEIISHRRGRSLSVSPPRGPTSPLFPTLTSPHPPPHHQHNDNDEMMTGTSPSLHDPHSIVSPFVEISLTQSDICQRTSTAAGPNPYWNEELNLPFNPPYGDFSPNNLAKVTDCIQFNLFDELTIDLLQDDRERGTNVHQRREKRWLGSFTLPFSTLHARTRIEDTFVLDVPKLLLGYTTHSDHTHHYGQGGTHSQGCGLQLFVSLEPPLSRLPPIRDLFSSSEEPHHLRRARQWLRNLLNDHPERQFLATVLDSTGHHVFATRYIHPQSPPVEISPAGDTNQLQAMELLAHYVSLIPFLPDAITFSGECDIWTTSDQFLHMLAGDEEEHAVLLTNYFLHCGWQAWLVLGHGIPEGPTAYVLTPAPDGRGGYWLWNASTGAHTTQFDPHCPLTSVGCVINSQNVWANVQEHSSPGRISFNFTNHKHWSPLLSTTLEPLYTVQRELVYDVTDQVRVRDLQEAIEREIRDHLMSLRSRFITRWNTNCGRTLHKMLIRYEERLFDPLTFRDTSELEEITTSYSLSGFPLHFSYANILHIVSALERTGLHLTENRRAEFGLSVYVHPYPNDVVSVWVFLVTMIPK